jgi:hypothetical protein
MQIERQVASLCLVVGAAFTLPEVLDLLRHPSLQPSYYYLIGGVMGAVGLYLGMPPSLALAQRLPRRLLIGAWLLVALLFSLLMQLGAYSTDQLLLEAGSYLAAALPLAAFAAALVLAARADRKA